MDEGIVIGGGCTFLKLAAAVDEIKETLDNDEQGWWKSSSVPFLPDPPVSNNSGVNGSVVCERVMTSKDPNFGFNVAAGEYEDLMESSVLDPASYQMLDAKRVLCRQDFPHFRCRCVRDSGGGAGDRRGCWERDGFQRLPAISA